MIVKDLLEKNSLYYNRQDIHIFNTDDKSILRIYAAHYKGWIEHIKSVDSSLLEKYIIHYLVLGTDKANKTFEYIIIWIETEKQNLSKENINKGKLEFREQEETKIPENLYLLEYYTNKSSHKKQKVFTSIEKATQFHLNFSKSLNPCIQNEKRSITHYEIKVVPLDLEI